MPFHCENFTVRLLWRDVEHAYWCSVNCRGCKMGGVDYLTWGVTYFDKLSPGNTGANRTNACSVFVECRLKSCQRWAEVVMFVPTRLYILWRPWGKIITDSIEAFRVLVRFLFF